jgi:hypothetical protein
MAIFFFFWIRAFAEFGVVFLSSFSVPCGTYISWAPFPSIREETPAAWCFSHEFRYASDTPCRHLSPGAPETIAYCKMAARIV